MPFNVNDKVTVRKLGGQTGNKQVAPDLEAIITEVDGSGYRVAWVGRSNTRGPKYYPTGLVPEADITPV